jgi:hypothetical protein
MAETINTGSILFKDETLLPDALRFDSEPCATGWRLVKDLDGYELNRRIHDAGWRFFCIAGEIKSSVFGFEGPKTVRRAVKRMLARLRPDKFNSLQITRVASKRFLGVPYVRVSACSRHIQESLFLLGDKNFDGWDRARPTGNRAKATLGWQALRGRPLFGHKRRVLDSNSNRR